MSDRFFVDSPIDGDAALLRGAEAHHLLHVMRAAAGDEVTLFDGSGWEFRARIERLGRADIELSICKRTLVDRELPIRIVLGICLPKQDRQRSLIEKCVELGAGRLVPLVSSRATVRGAAAASGRLDRYVIEASKQCGRNHLMEIAEPVELADYLTAPGGALRLLAQPNGAPLVETIGPQIAAGSECRVAIGPEGGFTEAEEQLATEHGWQSVSLGGRTLRIETAAAAMVAVLGALAGGSPRT